MSNIDVYLLYTTGLESPCLNSCMNKLFKLCSFSMGLSILNLALSIRSSLSLAGVSGISEVKAFSFLGV